MSVELEEKIRGQVNVMADNLYQEIMRTARLVEGAEITIKNIAINVEIVGMFGFSVKSLNLDFKFDFKDE